MTAETHKSGWSEVISTLLEFNNTWTVESDDLQSFPVGCTKPLTVRCVEAWFDDSVVIKNNLNQRVRLTFAFRATLSFLNSMVRLNRSHMPEHMSDGKARRQAHAHKTNWTAQHTVETVRSPVHCARTPFPPANWWFVAYACLRHASSSESSLSRLPPNTACFISSLFSHINQNALVCGTKPAYELNMGLWQDIS